ncbi:hypothetical protein HYV43_04730 [Candidatus Micrarchaeota archaeon]|nr:hypothetical protein [Candidatus Micrarchaeota archaeon]
MSTAQKLLAKLSVFDGSNPGSIEVAEDKTTLHLGKTTTIRQGYVVSVQKTGDLALNKVAVSLEYFDLFGNKESKHFAMHENDLKILKKALGK